MLFNDLLNRNEIDTKQVIVFRHRPWEIQLNKVLPRLAAERPDLFNAYQQTQGERTEQAMLRPKYVASFIGHEPGKALFVGMYANKGSYPMTRRQFWNKKANRELKVFGMNGFTAESGRKSVLWFNLRLTDFYVDWKGKLIVTWPPPELSWWRWADRNEIPVLAISEENQLLSKKPRWDEIVLSWNELTLLTQQWKDTLAQWRGVYFIFDTKRKMGYVGAAYGEDNLLGRWRNYAASGHGGNRLLRACDPSNFQFSILQLVAQDATPEKVIELEVSWKERLHTRQPFGLNDN